MGHDINYIITFVAESIFHIWPYLALTVILTVAIRVSGVKQYIRAAFAGRPLRAIILATIAGSFSPLCSITVVPVIASLLLAGVPLGPVMAFWIASPSVDPEMLPLSINEIGWSLSRARLAATLGLSLSAGLLTHYLEQRNFFKKGVLRGEQDKSVGFSWRALLRRLGMPMRRPQPVTACQASASPISIALPLYEAKGVLSASSTVGIAKGYSETQVTSDTSVTNCPAASSKENDTQPQAELSLKQQMWSEAVSTTQMVIKFVGITFTLEAIIRLYVPHEAIVQVLGVGNPFAIGLSTFVAIPAYTSNLAALPLIGSLIEQGMMPGAALAFLIAGPTTTIPAMAAVSTIAKRRVFALYMIFALAGAVICGYGYQLLLGLH